MRPVRGKLIHNQSQIEKPFKWVSDQKMQIAENVKFTAYLSRESESRRDRKDDNNNDGRKGNGISKLCAHKIFPSPWTWNFHSHLS